MENHALEIICSGLTITAFAWIWLLICTFRQSIWWGLGSLLLPPVAFIFSLRQPQKTIGPLVLFILGGFAVAGPLSYSLVSPVDLELRAKLQDGPKLWSLTGHAVESDAAHEWMASRAFYMQLGGLAIATIAWIWLLARAFRSSRVWGRGQLDPAAGWIVFCGQASQERDYTVTVIHAEFANSSNTGDLYPLY